MIAKDSWLRFNTPYTLFRFYVFIFCCLVLHHGVFLLLLKRLEPLLICRETTILLVSHKTNKGSPIHTFQIILYHIKILQKVNIKLTVNSYQIKWRVTKSAGFLHFMPTFRKSFKFFLNVNSLYTTVGRL